MDPQATLYNLLDNIHRNDRQAVDECLTALTEWNRNGGFLPTVDRPNGQHVAHYLVRNRVPETDVGPADAPPETGAEEPVEGLSPGQHLLLPVGWRKGDFTSHEMEVCVFLRWSSLNPERAVCVPLNITSVPLNVGKAYAVMGRTAWLNENSVMGSAMGSVDEES